ncbi:hypothetical protein FGG08_004996 [Glutinoglossum americanum]|uniref:BRCT domain-containing protein n=1 Tax=Glutinoglossum americanum TaxID=1670608 RepID=A0A9P8L1V6_9PEZI|nr:hypothetical protein FGG08_004996 [Glutinoglossum americanum]
MTESLKPKKKTKAQLEQMVKANGGRIFQTHAATPNTMCVADKRVVKVASLQKSGMKDIIHPSWLFDCIRQNGIDAGKAKLILPFEPGHMFFATEETKHEIVRNVDRYADSYARDVGVQELLRIIDHIPTKRDCKVDAHVFREQLHQDSQELGELPGWIFSGSTIYMDLSSLTERSGLGSGGRSQEKAESFDLRLRLAANIVRFAGGMIEENLQARGITHVVIGDDSSRVKRVREQLEWRQVLPRVVTVEWVELSWAEKTLLDEEREFLGPSTFRGRNRS